MTSDPFIHEASGTVRFWVLAGGKQVGAMIRPTTMCPLMPLLCTRRRSPRLCSAVLRCLPYEPVTLRESDFSA